MEDKEKQYIDEHSFYKDILMINTQYTLMSPYVDTTVLKIPESLLKGIYHSRYNRFLSEEYLLNFRPDNYYFGFSLGIDRFTHRDAILTLASKKSEECSSDFIKLPKPQNIKMSFSSVIGNRRSVRKFEGKMSIKDLSTILYFSSGVTGKMQLAEPGKDAEEMLLRSQPSGGGLYPIKLCILVWNVEDLPSGIYEYYPYRHGLKYITSNLENEMLRNLAGFGDMNIEGASFSFAYVYQLYINSHKYGDAGAAYAFIESGEIAMAAQLSATALGYGACDIGGYNKRFIEKLLCIDGLSEQVIHFTVFGKGA